MTNTHTITYRKDYMPPAYQIHHIDLQVMLGESMTEVKAQMHVTRRAGINAETPLVLQGRELELLALALNNQPVDYQTDKEHLTIKQVPADFVLDITTRIHPENNTSLEGLYKVKNLFCTQCEAEGFRKITYYLDRSDVMATFTTTIIADKSRYPVLLSNGNLIDRGDLPDGRHFAKWQDPFKKPCYLFALVAGDLACAEDIFTTMSDRKVAIKLYVDKGDEDKTAFALQAVKRAMRWDEENYGREYDLDIFMIVATHDFNMGAMENKGLNIFNAKYILAKPETATDEDYEHIERVIGHEYFHNWTGNRITCRDWFQLSLKEGLTMFRDAQFSADMTSPAVVRIDDVNIMRSVQFPQDASPMAHPVRPDSYMEINNFYTVTIYDKGAEVIRMLRTLLGKDGFRRGMDLYFQRHDGQAVTLEDFVQAHADANHIDLKQFMRWYDQAGTPELIVDSEYNADAQTYTLHIKQHTPPTPGQTDKLPLHIPFAIGLFDAHGHEIRNQMLEIKDSKETFTFDKIAQHPLPSLLRDFSAPVKVHFNYTEHDLAFLLKHDTDPVARWDAGQKLALKIIQQLITQPEAQWQMSAALQDAWSTILQDEALDPAFAAALLVLPNENYLIDVLGPIDLDKLFSARRWLRYQLAHSLHELFSARYAALVTLTARYKYNSQAVALRTLKNRCLSYLGIVDDESSQEIILKQLHTADNMTDEIAALSAISHSQSPVQEINLEDFYAKWQLETLVVDKWLSIQARSELPGTLNRVKSLMQHPAFNLKNPNKVRALISAFTANLPEFHALNGSGYQFLSEQISALNTLNPIIAARLLEPFTRWQKYDEPRQKLIKAELEKIRQLPNLAVDVFEVVQKSLQT